MGDRRTFKPVTITIKGKKKTLRTVLQAGNTLLDDWPEQTMAAKKAERLVLDVLNDVAEPEDVRRALIAAAEASGLKHSQ
ncbi:DUF982 domain-containing protein [Rhizobium leucaenae]|uniref:Transposase-like protein n=1 Tax=Rhizobium leucaenae TaxID=29450 RepID=A0A7W7EPF6_9HYPH|nr:DUF982 domain-containing protein [Rhizobium leucaenae]MBB4571203.1 transposase-like protein [Rhizobium leucaenae]MBB6304064.1 transposase-like protein [Rhizobium leucaenae]